MVEPTTNYSFGNINMPYKFYTMYHFNFLHIPASHIFLLGPYLIISTNILFLTEYPHLVPKVSGHSNDHFNFINYTFIGLHALPFKANLKRTQFPILRLTSDLLTFPI